MVFYHYTTQEGLLGILSTQELWATDIRCFNDARELQLVFDTAMSRVPHPFAVEAGTMQDFYRSLHHSLTIQSISDGTAGPWVISFSADGDTLSQWRAYSSPVGYALGFEVALPSPSFDPPEVSLVECQYDQSALENAVDSALSRILDAYDANPTAESRELGSSFGSELASLAPAHKHHGFREESEWRVVVREAFVGNQLPMRFRPGRSTLVPYYGIPFVYQGHRIFRLREVVVGPTVRRELAESVLTALLIHTDLYEGRSRPAIRFSEVPYRDV
jgi:hypothetical protein